MKKKRSNLIFQFVLVGVLLIFASSCIKDDDDNVNNTGLPVVVTSAVTDITKNTASSGGNITSDGGATVTVRGVCWSTGQTPTISDYKTTDGTGEGSFASSISGLLSNTTYYVRAYATNSNGTGYGSAISFKTLQGNIGSSFTDARDGNVYQTVTIGNQVWMAENLRYLPSVVGPDVNSITVPYYYVYGYYGSNVSAAKATSNYSTYGVLYNWIAAINACPAGWHLPTDAEWTELTTYLGGESVAGGKLKATGFLEAGTGLWYDPNTGATNETDFSALPGGHRSFISFGFQYENGGGFWWSATENSSDDAMYREMEYIYPRVTRFFFNKAEGYSVRCVKD